MPKVQSREPANKTDRTVAKHLQGHGKCRAHCAELTPGTWEQPESQPFGASAGGKTQLKNSALPKLDVGGWQR